MIDVAELSDDLSAIAAASKKANIYVRVVHADGSVSEFCHSTATAGAQSFIDKKLAKAIAKGGNIAFLNFRLMDGVRRIITGRGVTKLVRKAVTIVSEAEHAAAEAAWTSAGDETEEDTDADK